MHFRLGCFLIGAALLLPRPASACTIPVFRYALENWRLDTFDLTLFHRGPLPPTLAQAIKAQTHRSNVVLTSVDLDGTLSPAQRKLWAKQTGTTLPWLVVRSRAEEGPNWSGPATPENLAALIDSPARQRIVRAMSGGATAVFVLLGGGHAKKDEATREMIASELRRQEQAIRLPEQSADGPQIRLPLPLAVRFEVLTIRRDDPRERAFVQLMLSSEEGLDQVEGPILLPVFGRGRLLGSLYGDDLTGEQVYGVARFLCRACSCQLKELNPGADLIIAADWDAIFAKMQAAPPGPNTVAPATKSKQVEPRPAPQSTNRTEPPPPAPEAPEPAVQETPERPWLVGPMLGVGAAVGVVVAAGGWALARRRR